MRSNDLDELTQAPTAPLRRLRARRAPVVHDRYILATSELSHNNRVAGRIPRAPALLLLVVAIIVGAVSLVWTESDAIKGLAVE